jgi:hypothetical protein
MADETKFPWQIPYLAALAEIDPITLTLKIGYAEVTIATRLREQRIEPEELEALKDALRNLRFLLDQNNKPDSKASAA